MRSLRILMLTAGIVGCLVFHAMYLWRYFQMSEWWRTNIP